MATTWATVQSEAQAILKDADFQTGGTHVGYLLTYANDTQLRICRLVDVKRHLKDSTVTTTTSTYRYNMPADFLKLHPETEAHIGTYDDYIPQVTREYIEWLDPDHNKTTTVATGPDYICFEGSELFVYPMWAGTVKIKNYYRKPTAMSITTSEVDIISEGITADNLIKDLIVAGICEKVYKVWLNQPEKAQVHAENFSFYLSELRDILKSDTTNPFVEGAFGNGD